MCCVRGDARHTTWRFALKHVAVLTSDVSHIPEGRRRYRIRANYEDSLAIVSHMLAGFIGEHIKMTHRIAINIEGSPMPQ
jgi:hypothetical protein